MERRTAEREGRNPRALLEIDFLLLVDDALRPGALRFKDAGTDRFLGDAKQKIPPLVYLSKLLSASDRVLAEKDSDADLQLLFAPGSSLGGARPKAAVMDSDGRLVIAKFPQRGDEYNVELWSYLALKLAEQAGINIPPCQVVEVGGRWVLLVSRFDRQGAARIPFLSAFSLLGAADGETRSYLEIADALRQCGANVKADQRELWRRVLFSVLVSNVDDHLRNHGFLYEHANRGWRLSPAYDINPVPRDVKPPYLSTLIDEHDSEASFDRVLNTAEHYGLAAAEAKRVAKEVVAAVSGWRQAAVKLGIPRAQINRMASAFEHEAGRSASAWLRA